MHIEILKRKPGVYFLGFQSLSCSLGDWVPSACLRGLSEAAPFWWWKWFLYCVFFTAERRSAFSPGVNIFFTTPEKEPRSLQWSPFLCPFPGERDDFLASLPLWLLKWECVPLTSLPSVLPPPGSRSTSAGWRDVRLGTVAVLKISWEYGVGFFQITSFMI